ncbi:DNA phosphorothioation-dependent restriction protein DptF [Psychrosphaera haliotis]|uniref:DNA phosphorothioation-dependent restriction protein DptF n=1 Tax=Psychrosphaera haliotis TaxID=555083 RepID=A0A6N8F978_9GAMM|nr:DNA phosphorothioation-dependent restriction protein DptF [Psychrosphaera haliotis]MUH72714.1 DNA phosphorothioation-dependent restriction protein DptF [Psychrosphaera haliotis]
MRLQEVLSVLSKSSPYAVSTEREKAISNSLDEVKEYLYIETDIESDFKKSLTSLSSSDKKIIFLCGSSGDGKSEILTRYSQEYSNRADFHLDATHSFDPNSNAIQTLDNLFQNFELSTRPLVIGINIGMLGNYAQDGNNTKIVESIKHFLDGQETSEDHIFLNFESYPKFQLSQNGHASAFVREILKKITSPENNLIRQYFDKEVQSLSPNKRLCANYRLLCIPEVQERIIDVLFKARLMKDQFLTARTLLDFLHTLLLGNGNPNTPGYLYDNLFEESDNELSSKIIEFDPANHRTNNIDKFVLAHSLGLPDSNFQQYLEDLKSVFGLRKPNKPKPYSYLRLFYLLKNTDFSNQYHTKFYEDFSESLLDRYSSVWNRHNNYSGDPKDRTSLIAFYRNTVVDSIRKYNNRNANNLDKGQFLISVHNGFQVVAEIELKPDLDRIKSATEFSSSSFSVFLKLNEKSVEIPVNINLLNLMEDIVKGYRPNKHDKNTVVLLDELVDQVKDIAADSNSLLIFKNASRYKLSNSDDEYIEVSGV